MRSELPGRRDRSHMTATLADCAIVVGDFQTDCRDAGLYSHMVATIVAIMAGGVMERSRDVCEKNER